MGELTPASEMEQTGNAVPFAEPVCPCLGGNRFWMDNASGGSHSATFEIGGQTSPILPQTSPTHTNLPNTLEGSSGPLRLNFDGRSQEVLPNIDPALLSAPEDLAAGIIVGQKRAARPMPISALDQGIPFSDAMETADLAPFLPEGVTDDNTDIDLIMVMEGAQGDGALGPGTHSVDSLNESQAMWFLASLVQSTLVNTADAARATVADVRASFNVRTLSQMRSVLREVVFDARFYVKPIASWGGRTAIIFKGRHTGRAFLTSIMYGLRNQKMGYVSSYAQVAAAASGQGGGAAALRTAAQGVGKGNLLGFVIAGVVEISDFITNEDPEKNWGELLGGLGVAFVKVWVAGYVGVLAAGAFAAAVAGAPVILVVGVGIAAAIAVGFLLDWMDDSLGLSNAARRMGNALAGTIGRAAAATVAFVERIVRGGTSWVDSQISSWTRALEQNLRENDPTGWCALFCSSPVDQANAWMRGLGMR